MCRFGSGLAPTGMVETTVLVAVSMTETLLLSKLTTDTRVPSGDSEMLCGEVPTGIVAKEAETENPAYIRDAGVYCDDREN